jgi:hypothetical protein
VDIPDGFSWHLWNSAGFGATGFVCNTYLYCKCSGSKPLQRGNIQDTFTDLKTNNGTEEACCVGAHHPTIACLAAWVQVGQETVPQSSLLVYKPIYVIVDISMVNTYIYIFQPTETHHQLVILVGGFNPSKKI